MLTHITGSIAYLLKIFIVIETIRVSNSFLSGLSFNSTSVIYFQSIPENFLNIEKLEVLALKPKDIKVELCFIGFYPENLEFSSPNYHFMYMMIMIMF